MPFASLVDPILSRHDLTPDQAEGLMGWLMSGEATDAQIGGALLALRVKGCTTKELAAFTRAMRARMAFMSHSYDDLVDTCGTGGGLPTFNLSTSAAIVAAAAGVRVAKHGNRSMSGQGSTDVLEVLGIPFGGEAEAALHQLETAGIVFLFAPSHHPAMRHVARARKELGLRTVFNQLGPLANPAGARRQLIGVYDRGLMRSMGEALKELDCDRALLVHGEDGLDEISAVATTRFVQVENGRVFDGSFTPADFGIEPISPEDLKPGADVAASAQLLIEAITDPDSPRSKAVQPNAAAAIWLGGKAANIREAADIARATIASGAARRKLESLREVKA
ncbi:anthranilate phosphoribosyltransferase [bacterium]|nr:MAG: anthranilate phosphoribosyltransferase [bacterium]